MDSEKTPDELYKSLELQTASNTYIKINFGENLTFSAGCSSEEQIEYLKRIYAQAAITLASSQDRDKSIKTAEIAQDSDFKYLRLATSLLGKTEPNRVYLEETSRGQVYIPNQEYMVLDDERGSIWSISSMPEIGLSSTIRKSLMLEQFKKYPNLVPFHANSILDTRDGRSIVFSNPSIPDSKSKGGKTTLTLATVLQRQSPFAYFSNEDVYLAIKKDTLHNISIPAEINIGDGTYKQLVKDGVSIGVEKYTFDFNDEKHYMTSAGAIKEAGYRIAEQMGDPKIWTFVDLRADRNTYSTTLLDDETAKKMLLSTIKPSRLIHFHTPLVQGERLQSEDMKLYEDLKEQTEQNALNIFDKLKKLGTQFYTVSGGMDRQKLYSSILDLCKS